MYPFKTGGVDFELIFEMLVFGPSTLSEQCRNISIFLDSVLEDPEVFWVIAGINETQILGSPKNVLIHNSDSELLCCYYYLVYICI